MFFFSFFCRVTFTGENGNARGERKKEYWKWTEHVISIASIYASNDRASRHDGKNYVLLSASVSRRYIFKPTIQAPSWWGARDVSFNFRNNAFVSD